MAFLAGDKTLPGRNDASRHGIFLHSNHLTVFYRLFIRTTLDPARKQEKNDSNSVPDSPGVLTILKYFVSGFCDQQETRFLLTVLLKHVSNEKEIFYLRKSYSRKKRTTLPSVARVRERCGRTM